MTEQVAEFWSFPTNLAEFDADERISFSRLDNKFIAVQEDGTEYEFDAGLKRWIPTIDEALIEEHQAAYAAPSSAADDDEAGPSRNGGAGRKRKHNDDGAAGGNGRRGAAANKRQATEPAPRQNTAIYVTGLPLDATLEEVAELFSRKCGVIAEEIDGNRPRIKMYADADGNFKGDALIVFFKPQSVDMAIMLLDDTDFRFTPSGTSAGRIHVQAADASYKKTNYDQQQAEGADGAGSGSGGTSNGTGNHASRNGAEGERGGGASASSSSAAGASASARSQQPPQRSAADKQKIIKKTQKLDAKLADWDDDDPYPHLASSAVGAGLPDDATAGGKDQRVVVLKHMFTLRELEEDPAALLDIKEDVRDECEKLGDVTNVVLYDLEEDGIVSVRFRRPEAALACVRAMHGRSFAGRVVEARLSGGRKEKFRKSKSKDAEDGDDEDGG